MSHRETGKNVVEVEFRVTDPSYPFVAGSLREECLLTLEDAIPCSDGRYVEYYSVDGGSVRRVAELMDSVDGIESTIVTERDDGGLLEVVIDLQCVVVTISDFGAIPRVVRADSGTGTIVAEVPSHSDACELIEQFQREHPETELVARRERDRDIPLFTRRELQRTIDERLTDRQYEVLLTAYVHGYFEWPRANDGETISEMLGVSNPTFSEHLRAAIVKVLSVYFDDRPEELTKVEQLPGSSEDGDGDPG